MIMSRQWGKALDAGRHPELGGSPLLWDSHGLPWQRWLVEPAAKGGIVRIRSEAADLVLQCAGEPQNGSEVRLRRPSDERRQLWRLEAIDDGGAFLIESAVRPLSLDATQEPHNETWPLMWETHYQAWQQWIIARLPLSAPK